MVSTCGNLSAMRQKSVLCLDGPEQDPPTPRIDQIEHVLLTVRYRFDNLSKHQ